MNFYGLGYIYPNQFLILINVSKIQSALCSAHRFESVYLDDDIRVAKDIRGDYLVVERAPYSWNE